MDPDAESGLACLGVAQPEAEPDDRQTNDLLAAQLVGSDPFRSAGADG